MCICSCDCMLLICWYAWDTNRLKWTDFVLLQLQLGSLVGAAILFSYSSFPLPFIIFPFNCDPCTFLPSTLSSISALSCSHPKGGMTQVVQYGATDHMLLYYLSLGVVYYFSLSLTLQLMSYLLCSLPLPSLSFGFPLSLHSLTQHCNLHVGHTRTLQQYIMMPEYSQNQKH